MCWRSLLSTGSRAARDSHLPPAHLQGSGVCGQLGQPCVCSCFCGAGVERREGVSWVGPAVQVAGTLLVGLLPPPGIDGVDSCAVDSCGYAFSAPCGCLKGCRRWLEDHVHLGPTRVASWQARGAGNPVCKQVIRDTLKLDNPPRKLEQAAPSTTQAQLAGGLGQCPLTTRHVLVHTVFH